MYHRAFRIAAALLITVAAASCEMEKMGTEIVVHKKERRLEVIENGNIVREFTVVLGSSPLEDKEVEGDGRTPEGEFYVFTKNAESRFHLSLGLSYPSIEDAERGLKAGLISENEFREIADAIGRGAMPPQKTALGGEIYIHGGGTENDWTQGCVALENNLMTELFGMIEVGDKVKILK